MSRVSCNHVRRRISIRQSRLSTRHWWSHLQPGHVHCQWLHLCGNNHRDQQHSLCWNRRHQFQIGHSLARNYQAQKFASCAPTNIHLRLHSIRSQLPLLLDARLPLHSLQQGIPLTSDLPSKIRRQPRQKGRRHYLFSIPPTKTGNYTLYKISLK